MNKTLRTVLLLSFSAVLIYSATRIVLTETEYKRANVIYDESRSENFHISEKVQEASALNDLQEYFPEVYVDFETLKSTNPEVVG